MPILDWVMYVGTFLRGAFSYHVQTEGDTLTRMPPLGIGSLPASSMKGGLCSDDIACQRDIGHTCQ